MVRAGSLLAVIAVLAMAAPARADDVDDIARWVWTTFHGRVMQSDCESSPATGDHCFAEFNRPKSFVRRGCVMTTDGWKVTDLWCRRTPWESLLVMSPDGSMRLASPWHYVGRR